MFSEVLLLNSKLFHLVGSFLIKGQFLFAEAVAQLHQGCGWLCSDALFGVLDSSLVDITVDHTVVLII